MYIVNSNMILLPTKQAQHLENVKTPDTFDERELTRAIRDAIVGEESAIKQYEVIADACSHDVVKEIMQDISNEEKIHVGELQKVLNALLNDEVGFLEDGAKEVEKTDLVKEDTEDKEDKEEEAVEAEVLNKLKKLANMEASSSYDLALKNLAAMKDQIVRDILMPLEEARNILASDPKTMMSNTDESQELLGVVRLIKKIKEIWS